MRIRWLDPKRARRGWVALGIVSIACVVLIGLDADNLYVAGEGFLLKDTDWELAVGDLPGTWSQFRKTNTYRRVLEAAPELEARLNLQMRHTTGIRWTPLRWRLWFGRPAIAMGVDGDTILTTRAKRSTTLFLAAARQLGLGEEIGDCLRLGDLYIGEVRQFLIISTSPNAVSQFQSRGEVWSSLGGHGLLFTSKDNLVISTSANDDHEIDLMVGLYGADRDVTERPSYFAVEWPSLPILTVRSRGTNLDEVPEFLSGWWAGFPAHEEVDTAWNNFEALLPDGWRTGTDSIQFALFDVDTSETIPVPDAAVYARSETPLGPLMPPVSAIPYEWSGNAGWMTPWQGEGAHLFVVANDRARVFTNHEATMAALMARERTGRVVSEDALIEVDAPRLSKILIDLARKGAKNELWPEKNYDDVEHEIVPWLRAFGALGEIRLEGRYENGSLVLNGGTQVPKDAAE